MAISRIVLWERGDLVTTPDRKTLRDVYRVFTDDPTHDRDYIEENMSSGATEAGSSSAFSILNRAVRSNEQDQQNISAHTAQMAAKLQNIDSSVKRLESLASVVR